MDAKPEISVVAPCHNERDNLQPLADAIRAALDPLGLSYEIVLVDDCSTDGSWETLKELGRRDPRIRAQRFAQQLRPVGGVVGGHPGCARPIIVTMDSDMQNHPRDIPRVSGGAEAGYDCVCGTRVEARAQG